MPVLVMTRNHVNKMPRREQTDEEDIGARLGRMEELLKIMDKKVENYNCELKREIYSIKPSYAQTLRELSVGVQTGQVPAVIQPASGAVHGVQGGQGVPPVTQEPMEQDQPQLVGPGGAQGGPSVQGGGEPPSQPQGGGALPPQQHQQGGGVQPPHHMQRHQPPQFQQQPRQQHHQQQYQQRHQQHQYQQHPQQQNQQNNQQYQHHQQPQQQYQHRLQVPSRPRSRSVKRSRIDSEEVFVDEGDSFGAPKQQRGFLGARKDRGRNRNVITGGDKSASFGANEVLFVSNVRYDIVEDTIRDYLTKNGLVIKKIEKVSHKDARNASFKVEINAEDKERALSGDLWPYAVKVREYRHYRTRKDQDDQRGQFQA